MYRYFLSGLLFFLASALFLSFVDGEEKAKVIVNMDYVKQMQEIDVTRSIISTLSHESFAGRDIKSGSIELTKSFIENFLIRNNIKPLIGNTYRQKFVLEDNIFTDNIVALIDNAKPKNEYIVLCANYDNLGIADSYENDPKDQIYNGANDNASGCAALMQMAKFLNQFKFNKKVLIVFLSGKHYSNYGAGFFADFAKKSNINIKSVINIEMIGKELKGNRGKVYMNDKEFSNLSFELNFALRERFIVEKEEKVIDDMEEIEPKQDHLPFYNVYKIPANTITTFDGRTDSLFMSAKDDINNIDFVNTHLIINKLTYGVYQLLENDIEIKANY